MRRVLVTGGYGYLGGRIAQTLAAYGWGVTLGTRRAVAGAPHWLPDATPKQLEWNSIDSLKAASFGQDAVVHLAAMNELESVRNAEGALEVNGIWSLRLLEAALATGVQRFVYVSTAHVYRAPLVGEIDESCLPRPTHPYAITHKVTEDFVLAARDAGKINGVVLRLSNAFGVPAHPGVDRWTLLVNDLCRQAVTSRELVLQSAGLQRRDFITLEDAAQAVAHVLALPKQALGDGLFNLGGDAPLRIVDMAELVAARCTAVLGFTPDIRRPEPMYGAQSADLAYSSEKLKLTGWEQKRRHLAEIDTTLLLCKEAFAGRSE